MFSWGSRPVSVAPALAMNLSELPMLVKIFGSFVLLFFCLMKASNTARSALADLTAAFAAANAASIRSTMGFSVERNLAQASGPWWRAVETLSLVEWASYSVRALTN